MKAVIASLQSVIDEAVIGFSPISGGDSAAVHKLTTATRAYVLKTSNTNFGIEMLKAEALGLDRIANTNTLATPQVFVCTKIENTACLVTEYIASKTPSRHDFALFGSQLAALHKTQSVNYGLDCNNFIGNLAQTNTWCSDWTEFYSEYRLGVQFRLALEKGVLKASEIPSNERLKVILKPLFYNIKPTLIHGDLWGGNYIISKDGQAYLIDPAVYYGHSEIDIAMSKLFGGFSAAFYEAYHKKHPISNYFNERIDLYQLYYLLVHLNLFGSSYYGSVKRILNTYF